MPKTAPTKPTKPTRGGARPGAGRPALSTDEEVVVFHVRMPRSLKEKIEALGGGEWVRERARKAKTP